MRFRKTLPLLTLALLLAAPAAAQTPLGATLVPGGVQFAVFSHNATRIEVWIFATPTASAPTARYALTKVAAKDSVVYEIHLRGFTRNDASLAAAIRGTYDGFRAKGAHSSSRRSTARATACSRARP